MHLTLKSGFLYAGSEQEKTQLASIKSHGILGPCKLILSPDGRTMLHTDIETVPAAQSGDAFFHRYLLCRGQDTVATGIPQYAQGEDPAVYGWPMCRAPKVDKVRLTSIWGEYELFLHSCKDYEVRAQTDSLLAIISHKGLFDGWQLEVYHDVDFYFLCGLFVFCGYMDQENDFIVV